MGNVVKLTREENPGAAADSSDHNKKTAIPATPAQSDFGDIALRNGFEAYAVLATDVRDKGPISPEMGLNSLGGETLIQIAKAGDLSKCSVFLKLAETTKPFSFSTGLDCRTNETPDPSLSDNALDAVLTQHGLRGGYCVPVCSSEGLRSVVMYFGRRFERFEARYPGLVLETIECFADHRYQAGYDGPDHELSTVELSCILRMSEGAALGDISSALRVSDHAAGLYVRSAVKKLGASTVAQAILKASRLGLV